MNYVYHNPNPQRRSLTDCTVRAISTIMHKNWEETYTDLCNYGLSVHDMPSTNHVWGGYLINNGFVRYAIPNTCPNCYTIMDFAIDHPVGEYIVATGSHVVAVVDGNYYDTSNSGNEIPVYYYERRRTYAKL